MGISVKGVSSNTLVSETGLMETPITRNPVSWVSRKTFLVMAISRNSLFEKRGFPSTDYRN